MKKYLLILVVFIFFISLIDSCTKVKWGVDVASEIRVSGSVKDIENDTFIKNAELVIATKDFLSGDFYYRDTSYPIIDGRFSVIYKRTEGIIRRRVFIGRLDKYEIVTSDSFLNFTGNFDNNYNLKIKPLKKLLKVRLTDNTVDSTLIRTNMEFLGSNENIFQTIRKFIKIPKFSSDTIIILDVATNKTNYIDYWKYSKGVAKILWNRASIVKDTVSMEIN